MLDREELHATAEGIARNAAPVDIPGDEEAALTTLLTKTEDLRNQKNAWIFLQLQRFLDHLCDSYIALYKECNDKFKEFFGLRYRL